MAIGRVEAENGHPDAAEQALHLAQQPEWGTEQMGAYVAVKRAGQVRSSTSTA